MGSFFGTLRNRLLGLCLLFMLSVAGLFVAFVDLRPQVTPDFFFGSDDPDMAQSAAIRDLFPSDAFLIISVASPDIYSPTYFQRIAALSSNLQSLQGIDRLVSVSEGPDSVEEALTSPFWRPLLISENEDATLIIAFVGLSAPEALVEEVEAAARLFHQEKTFQVRLSGMPYIVEQIRRSLIHDIQLFSGLALAVFSVLLFVLFRSPMIVVGAAASGLTAILLTLLILHALGQPVGILTANLAIIVYVLVQSQLIYLTSNWRREGEAGDTVRRAIVKTLRASFWCTVTTLLGFATLLFVAAEPLRKLGAGGVIGALAALLCCFCIYPVFLLFAQARPRPRRVRSIPVNPPRYGSMLRGGIGLLLVGVTVLALPGLFRLNTDPSLLSYFAEETELREGLEFIDRNGGSSPAELVVKRKNGDRLDNEDSYEAMWRLHHALQKHPEVGTVISLPSLLAEANNHPLAFLLPWREIVSLLSLEINQNIANSFLTEDREQTLFVLRMKEEGRGASRIEVMEEIRQAVEEAGFEQVLSGGVYVLQGRLSDLILQSLTTGIFSLLLFIGLVGYAASRLLGTTLAMVGTASLIPVTILGLAGWLTIPVDVISAPAISVCLGIAVDALIHLALAVRRHLADCDMSAAWDRALREQSAGILASTGVIAVGFIIFAYSGFPPTTRFGMAIVLGALVAGCAALTLFPFLGRFLSSAGAKH